MTTNTQPSIDIIFKTLSGTAIQRGSRGKVGLVLIDDTAGVFKWKSYKRLDEVNQDESHYTSENFKAIKDTFIGTPAEVIVFKVNESFEIDEALKKASSMGIDWIGTNSEEAQNQTRICDFVKGQQQSKKYTKGVTFKPTGVVDSKQIVELVNENVTFNDSRETQTTHHFIPTILGVLAGLPLNRSATFYTLLNLVNVEEVEDIDTAIQNGKLVIFKDEEQIRLSTAVTSLVNVDNTDGEKLEAFTKIENVEVQNLIYKDIFNTFKNHYVGKGKNSTDRQFLFIGAVNSYFRDLAFQELLDIEHNNKAFIDVDLQRNAWAGIKPEATEWDNETVINTPFRTNLFLAGDVKFLESIENLQFGITLF